MVPEMILDFFFSSFADFLRRELRTQFLEYGARMEKKMANNVTEITL